MFGGGRGRRGADWQIYSSLQTTVGDDNSKNCQFWSSKFSPTYFVNIIAQRTSISIAEVLEFIFIPPTVGPILVHSFLLLLVRTTNIAPTNPHDHHAAKEIEC